MNKTLLSILLTGSFFLTSYSHTQDIKEMKFPVTEVKTVQETMPYKATIDGKRILEVKSDHICSITVIMSSQKEYNFSLLNWPTKNHVDESGYTTYVLKDTDNKPHILRTDQVKGKKFLTSLDKLIQNCHHLQKNNITTAS